MTRSTGYNVQRQLVGGIGKNETSQERRAGYQAGSAPVLQRAVVVDVITDPNALSSAELDALEDSVANPETVGGMPYNSIIARIVSHEHDLGDPTPFVFYPFFSSHFQLPVKAGEQVFIIYEDYSQTGNSLGYWMTRAPAARQAEDLNYTHYDRVYDPTNNIRNLTTSQRNNLTSSAPEFMNGAGTPETFSLKPSGSGTTNPFEDIVTNASASQLSVFEEVPRQRKRPGDFALFGSNNASITIGRDRTGAPLSVSGSQGLDVIEKSGTIDIVAGLGAPRKPSTPDSDPSVSSHNPTAPRVIDNSRNDRETDKTPYKKQKSDNPIEGDPDFLRDLSRVYVSMKTKGDRNFGTNFGNDNNNSGGFYTNTDNSFGTKVTDLAAGENEGQPFVVIKSEHVRLIAKGKDSDNGPDVSGDIRIIKEGSPTDDLAMMVMSEDGRIMTQGKKVYLQINDPNTGRILLGCKTDQSEDSDPMILYTKLKDELVAEIVNKLNSFRDTIADQFGQSTGLAAAFQTPNAAGPFSPVPALVLAETTCISAQQAIKNVTFDSINNKVPSLRSKNIFMKKDNQG
jgi:hypothetical protein